MVRGGLGLCALRPCGLRSKAVAGAKLWPRASANGAGLELPRGAARGAVPPGWFHCGRSPMDNPLATRPLPSPLATLPFHLLAHWPPSRLTCWPIGHPGSTARCSTSTRRALPRSAPTIGQCTAGVCRWTDCARRYRGQLRCPPPLPRVACWSPKFAPQRHSARSVWAAAAPPSVRCVSPIVRNYVARV